MSSEQEMREKFEAWARKHCGLLPLHKQESGEYTWASGTIAFDAFCAGWAARNASEQTKED